MSRPIDYKINHGCWNCKYLFLRSDYEDVDTYYCHQDASERPLCDSLLLKESFVEDLRKKA